TILFLFNECASDISGIIKVAKELKNTAGKFIIGSAIPFIIPNIDKDAEIEVPDILSALGINISSIVLSPL
ncbi:hypothetical protein L0O83_19000, partial [Lawsonibacter sp. DFI.5.51]|nr:hypothetical protein [Lawsonibacter sp. DFI.5.51]